jgi:ribonuclease P protein component
MLKRRSEFLRLRGGLRHGTAAFLIEGKGRANAAASGSTRFGFTVSKRLGTAVVRNRIRRRLKAAVGQVAGEHAEAGFDYVLVARDKALERPFALLKQDLERAFARIRAQARGER